ncbi:hypothetical protein, partial [Photorhabdus temperata]
TFFNWLFPFSSAGKGPWITVEGVAPKYTKPYVSAVYKSKTCLDYEVDSQMSPHKVPTYHGLNLDVKADPKTGHFQAKLPFSGGGWCKWKIDQAFVTIGYTDVTHLMQNAVQEVGAEGTGLTAFINDAVRISLSETEALNIINYSPTIYPVLKMVEKRPKRIFLQGQVAQRFFRLKLTPGAEWKITYKPKLDETKMPKVTVTKKGEWVEYPDGHIETDTQMVDTRYIK